MITRRGLIAGSGIAATGLMTGPVRAAAAGRRLNISLLGYALGDHVPTTAAIMNMLPRQPGFVVPKTTRMDQIRTVAQTVIGGVAELGECDPIVTMSAVEAGADLKIVGLWYAQTSLVLVADSTKVQDYKDLLKPGIIVAVNEPGDITQVSMIGPLMKAGIDFRKINYVGIGGSGARMRALLAGRVQVVPMHFDQAAEVIKKGKFKILMEPWKDYPLWVNEVWIARGDWLSKPANEKALVTLLKTNIEAFRRANTDFAWYANQYRKYATLRNVAKTPDAVIHPIWDGLAHEVKAWPPQDGPTPAAIDALIPLYKAAGAVKGTKQAKDFVVMDYVHQALAEIH